ncbi:MAG TPA: oligosaccharide flippase family protein [Candidatus Saccharimonadales bacterium]
MRLHLWRAWRHLQNSMLLKNSLYLMLATFSVAGFGFVFWIIVSWSYAASAIGLAATLLSVSNLLSILSLAGFDTTFIKFLPNAKKLKNAYISTGFMVVGCISIVLSFAFVLTLPLTSPNLAFVLTNTSYFIAFVFFTLVTSLNVLTNAIFLACRFAKDIFIINVIFSIVKVALPLLVSNGDVMTLFIVAGVSQLVGLLLSLLIIRVQIGYVFHFRIHKTILREVKKYASSVYVASIFNLLPPTLLPLLVVQNLGAESAAYFYMAFTIATALYTIVYSTMQSVFAEGSHDEAALKLHLVKALKLIGVLLVPAMSITVGLSSFILRLFGEQYAVKGSALLQLFALGALAVAASSAMGAIFKVTKQLRSIIIMNIVYAGVILGISYLFTAQFGIIAIGWAWLLGNLASAGTGFFLFLRQQNILDR